MKLFLFFLLSIFFFNKISFAQQTMRVNLYSISGSQSQLMDGCLAIYGSDYPDTDNYLLDARAISNNIAINQDSNVWTIEKRTTIPASDIDSVPLFWNKNNGTGYLYDTFCFQFLATDLYRDSLIPGFNKVAPMTCWLRDRYLSTYTPINLSDSTSITNIYIATDTNRFSFDTCRLAIIYSNPLVPLPPIIPDYPLPVTFSHITAVADNNKVIINWSVADEINIKEYSVEKSSDGKTFTLLTSINADGENYTVVDNHPYFGNNFYRVKSIDNTGSVNYSHIVTASVYDNPTISIYPSLILNKVVNIDYINQQAGKYNVGLYSSLGQEIVKKEYIISGQNFSQQFNLPINIVPGIYYLKIYNDSSIFSKKIIVE